MAMPVLRRMPTLAVALVAFFGLGAALAAPLFSSVATAATPHSGAIPSVTPTPAGGGGFGGPGGGGRGGHGFGGGHFGGGRQFAGGGGGGFTPPAGTGLGTGTGAALPTGAPPSGGFGAGGFGGGGFLSSSTSNPALTKLLQSDAGTYTWVAATVNSNSAAGYQLASDDPVMAIGGFNGTDPAPTLAQFEKYVAEGKIHYFIAGGGGGGFGRGGSGDDSTLITSWVESHYTADTVGGVTVYNLATAPTSS
jgi:hypothetical protein